MSFFGNRQAARRPCHSQGSGQKQCCQNHGRTQGHRPVSLMPSAGGALGRTDQITSNTTVAQPGMEMMPPSHGGMVAGGAPGFRPGVLAGMSQSEVEDALKDAPADVLAAAQRLSLIGSTMGMDVGGVVQTAPGSESTDTGMLSVS